MKTNQKYNLFYIIWYQNFVVKPPPKIYKMLLVEIYNTKLELLNLKTNQPKENSSTRYHNVNDNSWIHNSNLHRISTFTSPANWN